jgi:predicted NBD/HSP70 family sugar kinase
MDENECTVLQYIYSGRATTRQELSATGLSVNRVSAALSQLAARGLVREEPVQDGLPGRPVVRFSVEPDAGRVIGLDIGGQQSRAVVNDLGGNVVAAVTRSSSVTPDRHVILSEIVDLVGGVCQEAGIEREQVAALGVGVRGIVDATTGVVLGWPNTPTWAAAWTGVNLARELREALGLDPIVVDDSVRAMAVSAHRQGPARGSANFLYVFLGTGVGSALLIDGQPYYGGTGLAGELGHVTVLEDGPWCSCGNRGCLEVMASTNAVMQRVRDRLAESYLLSVLREPFQRGQLTLEALIEAARAGDKVAFQILDEAGTSVGKVVAIALNLLGPELVVLGGPLVQGDGIVLEAVRRQVRLRALQHIANRTRIIGDDRGELCGACGAALLATDALFSAPDRVARLQQPAAAHGVA